MTRFGMGPRPLLFAIVSLGTAACVLSAQTHHLRSNDGQSVGGSPLDPTAENGATELLEEKEEFDFGRPVGQLSDFFDNRFGDHIKPARWISCSDAPPLPIQYNQYNDNTNPKTTTTMRDCSATPMVDGEEYFHALADAMLKAETEILISGWKVTELFSLFAGVGLDWRNILHVKAAEDGVEVFLLLWSGGYMNNHDSGNIITALEQLAPTKIFGLAHPGIGVETNCHHQKFVVIDRKLAFVGGLDMADWRMDTQEHWATNERYDQGCLRCLAENVHFEANDVSQSHKKAQKAIFDQCKGDCFKAMGWHDLAVTVNGGAAFDVAASFFERWNHHQKDLGKGLCVNFDEDRLFEKYVDNLDMYNKVVEELEYRNGGRNPWPEEDERAADTAARSLQLSKEILDDNLKNLYVEDVPQTVTQEMLTIQTPPWIVADRRSFINIVTNRRSYRVPDEPPLFPGWKVVPNHEGQLQYEDSPEYTFPYRSRPTVAHYQESQAEHFRLVGLKDAPATAHFGFYESALHQTARLQNFKTMLDPRLIGQVGDLAKPLDVHRFGFMRGRGKCGLVRNAGGWNLDKYDESYDATIRQMIDEARHFVWIEEQYFLTDTANTYHDDLEEVENEREESSSMLSSLSSSFSLPYSSARVRNKIGSAILDRIKRAHRAGEAFQVGILLPYATEEAQVMLFRRFSVMGLLSGVCQIIVNDVLDVEQLAFHYLDIVGSFGNGQTDRFNKFGGDQIRENLKKFCDEDSTSYENCNRHNEAIIEYLQDEFRVSKKSLCVKFGDIFAFYHIKMFSLYSMDIIPEDDPSKRSAPSGKVVARAPYVHAKSVMADDYEFVVGSANINDRGMIGGQDSELGMRVQGDPAYVMRARTHRHMLGEHGMYFEWLRERVDSLEKANLLMKKLYDSAVTNTEHIYGCLGRDFDETRWTKYSAIEKHYDNLDNCMLAKDRLMGTLTTFPLDMYLHKKGFMSDNPFRLENVDVRLANRGGGD